MDHCFFCDSSSLKGTEAGMGDISDLHTCLQNEEAMTLEIAMSCRLRTEMNRHNDLITYHFPTEVVAVIFTFCLPEIRTFSSFKEDKSDCEGEKRILSGPLPLGAVCTAWRSIAWSSPALWTVIHVKVERPITYYRNCFDDKLSLSRGWLNRAGQLPLSLHLSYSNRLKDGRQLIIDLTHAFISMINNHSTHLQNLELVGPGWMISRLGRDLMRSPILSALRVKCVDRSEPFGYDFTTYSMFGSRSRPTRVSIEGFSRRALNINWTHVTHASVKVLQVREGIELLRLAPHLVYCRFYADYSRSSGHFLTASSHKPVVVPIIHHSLRYLEFQCSKTTSSNWNFPDPFGFRTDDEFSSAILAGFTFPCLTRLEFGDIENVSWGKMLDHLTRASCPLTSLTFLGSKIYYGPLLAVLEKTPLLRELELLYSSKSGSGSEADGHEEKFFKFLAKTSLPNTLIGNGLDDSRINTQSFLPNLQCIKFQRYDSCYEDPFWKRLPIIFEPISDLGNPLRRPLNTLKINLCGRFVYVPDGDEENTLLFRDLEDAGVKVELTHGVDTDEEGLLEKPI